MEFLRVSHPMFFPGHLLVSERRTLLRHTVRLICLAVIALKGVSLAAAPPSPIQPVPKDALLTLAKEEFRELWPAEVELFHLAQRGLATPAFVEYHEESDPANAAKWPPEGVVRADRISWLCTNPQASALVSHSGVQLEGIRIDGELNLANADIKFPFIALKCAFSHDISLQDAQLRGFYLLECKIMSLRAGRAILKGSLLLRRVEAKGEIHLVGAEIGGDLDCAGGHFSNARSDALNAQAAKVEGSVFLCKYVNAEAEVPFKVEGGVSLAGATIGGRLDCEGGQFSNPGGRALDANGAKFEGDVFLRNGFKAEGEVNLLGTTIAGDLDGQGGQFAKLGGSALVLESSIIRHNVFLREGFRARGKVSLRRATMGTLVIRNVLEADKAILDLRLAKVDVFWDDEGSWPEAGNLFLDGFRYERLYGEAPVQAGKRKKWLSLQPRDKFRPQPYEQLAAVLRQMGYERDARPVMIEKNRARARVTDFPRGDWWWYEVFGRAIGYGYAPGRAFWMSVGMILLGALLFRRGFKRDLIGPAKDNAYARGSDGQVIEVNGRPKVSEKYPAFNSFVYSLESFVPLLKLDQSANWAPNANHGAKISLLPLWSPRIGSLLRGYLYFHIASGWLLTSLWVGAITGLVKT